jgi:hypothetical protein
MSDEASGVARDGPTCSGVRSSNDQETRSAFAWSDGRRFVDVVAVQTGWLVIWGSLTEGGKRSMLGNRIYRDLAGVRRRIAAAVFELTADRSAVGAAVVQFDSEPLPNQRLTERSLPR